jgi:phosphoribosylamine---glycine ligase
MGAYSPVQDVTDAMLKVIKETIIDRLVQAMAAIRIPYRGVLYAGIMLTEKGPQLLEVNCRFGDPETQVLLPRLASDLVPYLLACASEEGLQDLSEPKWTKEHVVCVVLAPPEYPAESKVPYYIDGLEHAKSRAGVLLFYGDTWRGMTGIFTGDGRTLSCVGKGKTLERARFRAYVGASHVSLSSDRFHYREDIGEE